MALVLWRHHLLNRSPFMRTTCLLCERPAKKLGKLKSGVQAYGRYCSTHNKAVYEGTKVWILYKKDHCELCGFIPVNEVQLDVDHIDGNKENNSESNLQTLCANCHRLKTFVNNDWLNR